MPIISSPIETEPIFLKITGGWLNPEAILVVEEHRQNTAMLTVRVVGYERPLILNEADSAYLAKYLASREWPQVQDKSPGFVVDEGSA